MGGRESGSKIELKGFCTFSLQAQYFTDHKLYLWYMYTFLFASKWKRSWGVNDYIWIYTIIVIMRAWPTHLFRYYTLCPTFLMVYRSLWLVGAADAECETDTRLLYTVGSEAVGETFLTDGFFGNGHVCMDVLKHTLRINTVCKCAHAYTHNFRFTIVFRTLV